MDRDEHQHTTVLDCVIQSRTGHKYSLLRTRVPVCCGRAGDEHHRARRMSDEENDVYDRATTDHTVQFNIQEEAAERAEVVVSGSRVLHL